MVASEDVVPKPRSPPHSFNTSTGRTDIPGESDANTTLVALLPSPPPTIGHGNPMPVKPPLELEAVVKNQRTGTCPKLSSGGMGLLVRRANALGDRNLTDQRKSRRHPSDAERVRVQYFSHAASTRSFHFAVAEAWPGVEEKRKRRAGAGQSGALPNSAGILPEFCLPFCHSARQQIEKYFCHAHYRQRFQSPMTDEPRLTERPSLISGIGTTRRRCLGLSGVLAILLFSNDLQQISRMGIWDVYCNISGAMHFDCPTAFVEELRSEVRAKIPEGTPGHLYTEALESEVGGKIPKEILDGLLYSDQDVAASQDRVILCASSEEGSQYSNKPGAIKLSDGYWMLHDFEPCFYQEYQHRDEQLREYDGDQGCRIFLEDQFGVVTHCSLVIFRCRFPEFSPSEISRVVRYGNPREFHGCVAATQDQWVQRLKVVDVVFEYDDDEAPKDWWLEFLTRSDRTSEEIIHDAWMGPGNMWVFVRPDRFPVAEALALPPFQEFAVNTPSNRSNGSLALPDLPLDIILELCTYLPLCSLLYLAHINKHLRALIVPHLDVLVGRLLKRERRYLLPKTPSSAYRSNEEHEWWTKQWAEGGKEEVNSIPWTAYAKACATSRSMRSRKRIWDIAGEMEAAARLTGAI
ncbi:hypothetical protein FB45DRAFT_999790 [Roridomyces roridus]|uniref:F-box domain-containing protein n=1 Tax=Roridomyces roridus TaxID=1738132 RepID=A0AAD7FVA9_9AGAR|nr:hypothetical protein FB45DRAFT_999790 [Roridomyces roridus]